MTKRKKDRSTVIRLVTVPVDLSRARAGKSGKVWEWVRCESGRYLPVSHGFGCPVLINPLGRCWLAVDGVPADFADVNDARKFTQAVAAWLRTVPQVKITSDANLRYLWVQVPAEKLGDLEPLPGNPIANADRG